MNKYQFEALFLILKAIFYAIMSWLRAQRLDNDTYEEAWELMQRANELYFIQRKIKQQEN